MALLTSGQKDKLVRVMMRWGLCSGATYLKASLRQAFDDTDTWADSNASSFNSALNADFRGKANTATKTVVLALVIVARAGQQLWDLLFGTQGD